VQSGQIHPAQLVFLVLLLFVLFFAALARKFSNGHAAYPWRGKQNEVTSDLM
jgi:hypothetical protein